MIASGLALLRRVLSCLVGALIVFATAATMTGCSWKKPRPGSVLVLFVEQLGFDAFSCGEEGADDGAGGYSTFCAEAVRFTHAYAPSPLSQASIASALTGLYPYQHGIRSNGPSPGLDRFSTAAREAYRHGYRTSFFSGGPPIFRKSGFNIGFETFDDAAYPSLRSLYRKASDVSKLFLAWRDSEAAKSSFFSALYFADLQFPEAATSNELGEARDLSWAGQNAAVDEALARLIREMKARDIWDETTVFLVGLNAHVEEELPSGLRNLDLHSDALHIRLMAKPARRPGRESPFNWKIDANVTLADLGATLFDLTGAEPSACDDPAVRPGPAACGGSARPVSLKSVLYGPQPSWPSDRAILAESAWALWHGIGGLKVSLRQGPYLYVADGGGSLFNAYSDPAETTALPIGGSRDPDGRNLALRNQFAAELAPLGAKPWRDPPQSALENLRLGARLFKAGGSSAAARARLLALSLKKPQDTQLLGWRAAIALREENWNELKAAGEAAAEPMWSYVASLNMGLRPSSSPEDSCLRAFRRAKSGDPFASLSLRECVSPDVLELISWVDDSASPDRKQKAQDAFLRTMIYKEIDEQIAERNYAQGLSWDVAAGKPGPPLSVDLLLALPENRKYRSALARLLATKRADSL